MHTHDVKRWSAAVCLVVLLAVAAANTPASAQIITLQRPPEGEFIIDKAGLIEPEDADHIRTVCQRLLTEDHVPLIVVVINAMSDHGGAGLRVETFTTLLFDQWGIGSEDKNLGILLFVSKQDRVSRIALGADWERDVDRAAQRIMEDDIIPHFKAGQFSAGIRAGVDALDALVRPREADAQGPAQGAANVASNQPAPPPSVPAQQPPPQQTPAQAVPIRHVPRSDFSPSRIMNDLQVRTTHGRSGGFGGGAFVLLAVVAVGASLLRGLFRLGGGSGSWRGGGFFSSGMGGHHHHHHDSNLGGGLFSGGFGGHHSGFGGSSFGSDSSSHSSHSSGSSFGGGHTTGGGATGKW